MPVAERALLARVNRAIASRGERIIRTKPIRGRLVRGKPVYPDVGRFYHVSTKERAILARDVDLAAFARDLGLLQPWEAFEPVPAPVAG